MSVSLQPNPAVAGETLLATVQVREVKAWLYTLPATGWTGNGPYEMTVAVEPEITQDVESLVYGDHTMGVEQRASELNAMLRAEVVQPGRVRFRALSIKPTKDLRMRIVSGVPSVIPVIIPVGWWSGAGPWTASVDIGKKVNTAAVGVVSESDSRSIVESSIHVSAVNGSVVTFRAMFSKPLKDLTVGVVCI